MDTLRTQDLFALGERRAREVSAQATEGIVALASQLSRGALRARAHQAERARHELAALMTEQPLLLGIAGFALGILIGGASVSANRRKARATQRLADPEARATAAAPAPDRAVSSLSGGGVRGGLRGLDPISGAIAGAVATAPMTAVMTSLRRRLPGARRHAIPPRQITRTLAARAGVARALDAEQLSAATYGAHVGYGGALGSVYPAFASRLGGPRVLSGALFGLLVWGVSYLGWLPASGILRSALREPAGRNAMMIGAHLVWGGATGLLYEATRSESPEEVGAARRTAPPGGVGKPA